MDVSELLCCFGLEKWAVKVERQSCRCVTNRSRGEVELSNALHPKNSVGTQLLLQSLSRASASYVRWLRRGGWLGWGVGWGVLARDGGVIECVKLRRQTFDTFE